jgi:hypothetical protein
LLISLKSEKGKPRLVESRESCYKMPVSWRFEMQFNNLHLETISF